MPNAPDPAVERLLQLFLEQTSDEAVICIDARQCICAWMGASEEIFGYSRDEALGKPAGLIFTPEDKAMGLDKHELHVAEREARAEDDRWHVRKDGARIWISGSVNAIRDEGGQLLGFVKVVRDKTDLRTRIDATENQLQAIKATQKRARVFLSTLGHELRNPLSPMRNAVHIMRRIATDGRAEKALDVIDRQVDALSRLAEDLMEVSRVSAGKVTLDLQLTDLRGLLEQAVFAMRADAEGKGVTLEALLPARPLEVKLDVERFQRVVLNLLSNAIKYTPSGGTVWLKATMEGSDAVIRVQDTGIGISAQMLPRIFELFTQDGDAADLVPGGLGIGLTIVKELVELHEGNVEARSAGTGKGAEFTVRLRAAAGDGAAT